MRMRIYTNLLLIILVANICLSGGSLHAAQPRSIHLTNEVEESQFASNIAWHYLTNYSEYSPILPGSNNHSLFLDYARQTLTNNSWTTILQSWQHDQPDIPLTNIIGIKKGTGASNESPIIVLGAHYDARLRADKDANIANRDKPVPGVNDGGSGVAVLLELSRVLNINGEYEIWIVLFDAEDQGDILDWAGGIGGWCIGSTYFVNQLNSSIRDRIEVAIIVDIVGSPNLRLTREGSSTPNYIQQIWDVGHSLGYNNTFLDILDGSVIDDHTPFLNIGIAAIDIIQIHDENGYLFFQWHHTRNDTLVHVSELSLSIVGTTLESYLESHITDQTSGVIIPFWRNPLIYYIGRVMAMLCSVILAIMLVKHRKRLMPKKARV